MHTFVVNDFGQGAVMNERTTEADAHFHDVTVDRDGDGSAHSAGVEPYHAHEIIGGRVQPELGHTHGLTNNQEIQMFDEEKPLGMPVMDFSKPAPVAHQRKQRPAPTVRQQYPLVANQGEETPLGQPTWNFAPADDRPDESELVANDNEEQPMSNQTWQF